MKNMYDWLKRVVASLLALSLVWGHASLPAYANESGGDLEIGASGMSEQLETSFPEDKKCLPPPEDIGWASPTEIFWSGVENCEGKYELRLYWSPEEVEIPSEEYEDAVAQLTQVQNWRIEDEFGSIVYSERRLKEYISETGWYYAAVKALGHGDVQDSIFVFTAREYIQPDTVPGTLAIANRAGGESSLTVHVASPGTLRLEVESEAVPEDVADLTITGRLNQDDLDYLWLKSGTGGTTALTALRDLDLSGVTLEGTATLYFKGVPLEKISLPNCTSIPDYAFQNCDGLQEVVFPATLDSLGDGNFVNCPKLREIDLSPCNEMSSISDWCFYQCTALENVKLPTGLERLGYQAFSSCTSLRLIELPAWFQEIRECAFGNCKDLTVIIKNPSMVASVSSGSFPSFEDAKNILVIVPDNIFDDYVNDPDWRQVMQKEDVQLRAESGAVCAKKPQIITPPTRATITKGSAHSLYVFAVSTDGGTLSYQWYKDGVAIVGATGAAYTVSTDLAEGYHSFEVEVTNTLGATHISARSYVTVQVVTEGVAHAQAPMIKAQPQGASLTEGDAHILTVDASITDGGVLSYQWYRDGYAISGANTATYTVPGILSTGSYTFYVVITNSNIGATGSKVAVVHSAPAVVQVSSPAPNAQAPVITVQPQGKTITQWQSYTMNLSANVTDGGTLSYQWYRSNSSENSGGTAIAGAVSNSYIAPSAMTGTTWYYCAVTNTLGAKTTTSVSNTAAVTVNAAMTYNVSVNGGTGGGNYAAGTAVTVTADPAPNGQRFKQWSVSPSVIFTTGTSEASATAIFTMPTQAVIFTATYEAVPIAHYSVNIQNDGNGIAAANANSATQGTEIILTATPNSGYIFKEWQIVSGSVSIVGNRFTMPSESVTIKAIFEALPSNVYTLSISGSYAPVTGAGNYPSGAIITIHAGSRKNYIFTGWTTPDDITFANQDSSTTFIMPPQNVNIIANWKYIGNSGGSIGSSGGSSGGRGSNSGGNSGTAATPRQPLTVNAQKAKSALAEMSASKRKRALIRHDGVILVPGDTWTAFGQTGVDFDTMNGTAVQVRVSINAPEKLSGSTYVSGSVSGHTVDSVCTIFKKWFRNSIRVIHLDNESKWEQPVWVAAKVDLTGMDAQNLYFYSYNKEKNQYTCINNPNYRVDRNGYLHFYTDLSGEIVISEGALERK